MTSYAKVSSVSTALLKLILTNGKETYSVPKAQWKNQFYHWKNDMKNLQLQQHNNFWQKWCIAEFKNIRMHSLRTRANECELRKLCCQMITLKIRTFSEKRKPILSNHVLINCPEQILLKSFFTKGSYFQLEFSYTCWPIKAQIWKRRNDPRSCNLSVPQHFKWTWVQSF